MKITSVDDEQVGAHVASRLLHATSEGHKVTPVGTKVLLLEVTSQPAMGIGLVQDIRYYVFSSGKWQAGKTYGVEEVDLTPFQGGLGAVWSIWGAGLDALNVTDMLDRVDRTIAGFLISAASDSERNDGSKAADEADGLHIETFAHSF